MSMASVSQIHAGAHLPGLIWTLVRTDFKARYHGTCGGYLWALAKPLVMFVVLMAVFSVVFSVDPNYKLNLIIGLFIYEFFSESTRTGLGSLHAKAFLITRTRFPNWVVVATSPVNTLLTLTLFLIFVTCYAAVSLRHVDLFGGLLILMYLLCLVVVVVGLSLATSVLFLRYRDLNQFWDLAMQAGFFVAPVIYPLDLIPERFHFYLYIWPPTPVMQFTRAILVAGEVPSLKAHLFLLGTSATILAAGVTIYRRLQPWVIETL
jgi:lipopolysaccharide transport system permease protein